jgi:amino acid adenylation domain-containing protein
MRTAVRDARHLAAGNGSHDSARDVNATWSAYPRGTCVDALFKQQAAANPHAVALLYEGARTSYRELDEASDRLAGVLAGLGCGREAIVGVCLDRSPALLVAMLAILKAGGAYLPLDASYPLDRLIYMVDNAACSLVVGSGAQLASFAAPGRVLVDLDQQRELAAAPRGVPAAARSAADAAYVMYTSGTTGEPKGVLVEHRNIARLVLNTNYVQLGPADVFLQLAPVAFDASTFEIWGALLNGGTLVLYDRPYPDIHRIGTLVAEHGVSVLWLSAGFFNQVVEASVEIFGPVGQLLVGGDVLSVSHVAKVMDRHPGCQVINGYGPTECTTFSVCCRIERAHLSGASIPIGKPVANARVYILDEQRRPVPAGQPGELYIAGEGVARGYLGAPELTAEKFVHIAAPGGALERVYRTGDLVRLDPDGTLAFLGRADRQLKVRGFRVEPAEIEAALLARPGIAQAVVAGIPDKHGDKRLVAYVVGPSGAVPGSLELRDALREVLPAHMVPATFVYLDRIPLTANGKVDRGLLPKPEWKPLAASPASAARTPLERELAELWAGVPGSAGTPDIRAGLSEAGGNDATLAALLARVRARYGFAPRGLDPRTTTIASLVDAIRTNLHQTQQNEAASMSTGEITASADAGARLEDAQNTVRAIWKEVLDEDAPPEIGLDDDFFELGGTSLSLVAVVTKMGQYLDADLPTDIVAKGATVRALTRSALDFAAQAHPA